MQLISMLLWKHGKIGYATRNRYTAFVRGFNLDDIKVKKVINSSFWEVDEVSYSPALNFLSIKLSEHLPSILHTNTLQGKGLDLFNNPVAISRSPSIAISNTFYSNTSFSGNILLPENDQKFLTKLPLPSKGR